jgi:endonuclease G
LRNNQVRNLFLVVGLALATFASCFVLAQDHFDYLPTSTTSQVVSHDYYSLSYAEVHEQAEWVAYELSKEKVGGPHGRSDNFRADAKVITGSASLMDYKGSGYDRGHLVPAADMSFSEVAMSQTFFMSNMSPQQPSFNRGIWKKLEEQVRTWAVENEHIYVVTGPVLTSSLQKIGPGQVTVPTEFYKVVLDYKAPEIKAIALLLPNKKGEGRLSSYAVTIDHLERITGIDFFPALPNDMEEMLESRKDISRWSFTPLNIPVSKGVSSASQCMGTAKSTGVRCRNWTKKKNGYCHVHQYQADGNTIPEIEKRGTSVRCRTTTKAGNRCKRNTYNANARCWQHQ